MTWISTIPYRQASGALKRLYDRIKGPDNKVDNIMLAHSLRPHTMEGHLTLYKHVLHHSRNRVPGWYLETIGVYVSLLNNCSYCVAHHSAGMARLLNDPDRATGVLGALENNDPSVCFSGKELAGLEYAARLTVKPPEITAGDIERLRMAGFDDGEILEINQVAAYFAYANRTVLGLGVDIAGDIVGLSSGDTSDPDNWSHS
jgi:uncharacterized peroxidase-related enzyme